MSKPWRFAPLDTKRGNPHHKPALKGIVFDVDGTLCEPQNHMFREMREALGIEKPTDILDHINSLPGSAKEEAQEKIRAIERRAMALQRPQPGLTQLMDYLDRRGVRKAICTRNFDEPINHLLTTFIPHSKFHPIVTRAFHPPKPNPAGILHICQQMGLEEADRGDGMVMVGDSIDDMAASAGAGSTAVLLVNAENEHLGNHEHTDVCISRLDALIEILESGDLPA